MVIEDLVIGEMVFSGTLYEDAVEVEVEQWSECSWHYIDREDGLKTIKHLIRVFDIAREEVFE